MMREITGLDRLEEIRRIDKSGMLDICAKTPEHCRDAIQRAKQIGVPREVKISERVTIEYKRPRHVIIVGMGGSAVGGEILRDWLRDRIRVPIEVCKDYTLPAYASRDTLVFAVSYSGNTEETLSAFVEAIKRGCMIATVTSGGHLLSFSERLHVPHITIPNGLPPRVAIPYLFFPLPILMEKMGLSLNIDREAEEAVQVLKKLSIEAAPQSTTVNNPSKKLALELEGTIPVVYGFRQYGAVARRLKTQFNENSKLPSKHDVFPELNHNEVVGWEAPETLTKRFSIILLRDRDEPPEIKNIIESTKLLALHKAHKVLEIYARGQKKLAKVFSLLYIGDLASIYLAILRKTDPTPVETIDKIKGETRRKFNMIELLQKRIRKTVGK